ncbi:MAG: transglutaminase domain-containing protein [Chloroflexi bacterium]|nr:transglutaminase domain-containing protein [Chloroflexota bacterium]
MSTATDFLKNVPGPPSIDEVEDSQSWVGAIGERLARFAPVYDWVSLLILIWMMVNVGWSVQVAGWGDLPSIIPTLLLGTTAAFVVSKLNFKWFLTILYAVGLGILVVFWQGAVQASGDDPITKSIDAVARIGAWIETAQTGGISTDTVPFAVIFMTASWIVGYGVTALTFRFGSPWLPTVLLSLVILTNLSYRHGEHEITFFLFLVGGIVLFAHLTTVRRISKWQSEGIDYSRFLGWVTVQDGLLFALPVVLLSSLLPIWEPRSEQLNGAWDVFRAPFYALREPANRLLAGIDGPVKGKLLATPSQSIAFSGPLELTDEPLLWVRSKYVVTFAGRVYQEYTSQGWLTDLNTKVKASPRSALTLAPTELERERVALVYVPLVTTKAVMPAGGVFSVDRETVVQILNPMQWQVPLTGSVARLSEMPQDLRDMAFAVRFALVDLVPVSVTEQRPRLNNQPLFTSELVDEVIQALRTATETGDEQAVSITAEVSDGNQAPQKFETVLLPLRVGSKELKWDEITIDIKTDSNSGLATLLDIERVSPIEQVGVELAKNISKDDTFSVQTFVSLATDEQLNDAGTDYPTWITDRYLQLPSSLPDEVRELASQIVREAGAETPFEKAEAVRKFLIAQEYSLRIAGPEFGVDGIFYFLFQTRAEPCPAENENCDSSKIKGYSQYFGSSAAVLLRAVGVPARFVAGWSSGEYVPEAGLFLIRNEDRHGWSQVYFPGYGWINYETTPGQTVLKRGQLAPVTGGGDVFAAGAIGAAEDDPDFLNDLAALERLARLARADAAAILQASNAGDSGQIVFPWRPFAWTGGVVGSVLLMVFAWWLSLRGMDAPTRAYARMSRIAALMGMRRQSNETAKEFANNLGSQTFAAQEHASIIADEFQRVVYAGSSGSNDIEPETWSRLDGAWRRVARALVAHRVRQLGRLGPELGES